MNKTANTTPSRRVFLAGTASLLCPFASNAATQDVSAMIAVFTDQMRVDKGRQHLRTSPRLDRAAEVFSQVLAQRQAFSHTADGRSLSARAASTGYRFLMLGENIGWTSRLHAPEDIANDLVKRWMASRGHRANILNGRFHDIGVGVTQSGGRTYAVQMFGTKA